MTGVRATGRQSFTQVTDDDFGPGDIIVLLKHAGKTAWLREVLKTSARMSARCSAQSLSTRPGMLSSPAFGVSGSDASLSQRGAAGFQSVIVRNAGVNILTRVTQSTCWPNLSRTDFRFVPHEDKKIYMQKDSRRRIIPESFGIRGKGSTCQRSKRRILQQLSVFFFISVL